VATWGGVGLKALFPGQTGPVAATWFTGKLKLPPSARALNPHWPHPLEEKYLMITVEKGRVVSPAVMDNFGGTRPPGHHREPVLMGQAYNRRRLRRRPGKDHRLGDARLPRGVIGIAPALLGGGEEVAGADDGCEFFNYGFLHFWIFNRRAGK
jgi:hypothetical protein